MSSRLRRPVSVTVAVTLTGLLLCGPVHAAAPTPVTPTTTPTTLEVHASGLPRGVTPRLSVAGPNGFAVVTRRTTVTLPGAGTVRAWVNLERVGAYAFRPVTPSITTTVARGSTTTWNPVFRRVAPATRDGRVELPAFTGVDLWVDPRNGSDARSGTTRATALATVAEAWRRIPSSHTLTVGVRINLARGTYPASALPNYWEHRWGTAAAPLIIRSVDGPHAARLAGDLNVFDVRHLVIIGVDINVRGDAFHCERCGHVVLREMELSGGGGAQEVVKVNQSDHVYLEDSDIHGAWDNAIDFVAVTAGHIVGNRIHDAGDWCAYAKGGSAGISVIDNEIFNCGTGGFTAGQGTGFEFMQAPYLHYEAYGIRVIGNLIHDTAGAGLGVNGGYDVVMAFNSMYRVGSRSHAVEFVQGGRGCDAASAGEPTTVCAAHLAVGGWGTTGEGGQWIPNRRVVFVNNLVANPPGFASAWSHFDVHSPAVPPAGSGVGSPARADDGLLITGNVLLNGDGSLDLGIGAGACEGASTCSPTYITAHNVIGPSTLVFRDPLRGDYRLRSGALPLSVASVMVPTLTWSDSPAPAPTPLSSGPATPSLGHPGAWRIA